jgi:hypothetical protein
MLEQFACITPTWLQRAHVYTGSVGPLCHDFRYRLAMDGKEKVIHAARYSKLCYELATDVEQQDFPWDEAGAAALGLWLQEGYEAFLAREGQA